MTVEFRLLGSVEAWIGGRPVDVGPARQRCVLAVLLVDANEVVSTDQLVHRVWGDRVPRQVRGTLHSYLSRLRQALSAASGVELARRAGGYALTVDAAVVDLHRFRALVAGARAAADDDALPLWEQALGLWRGEAFTGLDTPWIADCRRAVEAERLAAELDHNDLRLRRGEHAALVVPLATSAADRPLDERLAGQLMVALYRCGRQADALAHYQQVRTQLAEELGTDPGRPLRQLHRQILTADPALAAPAESQPARGGSPVPRQLPVAPASFAGRELELGWLTAAANGAGTTVVIMTIAGAGGIGKTWLALHWAHRHADRFPDGQLFVDLQGFTPAGRPTPPGAAVRGFLDALGVEPDRVPVGLDAQVGLYRSLTAGRRMLIVLDNARDTDQVSPLLPGSPTCTVIVTSRNELAGLVTTHGAHPIALDVLTEPEARDVLARRLGPARLAAEPEAAGELLAYCEGLPLALGIVTARAITHSGRPLSALVDELRDNATRLEALDLDEPTASLPAVLSWSYAALTPAQAEAFGLLALAPGPDIGLPAATSLAAAPAGQTSAVLRALERASLVRQHVPGRWRMHDLVRLYASRRARHDQSHDKRAAALRRLIGHYTHTACAADRLLDPTRQPIELDKPSADAQPHPLPDPAAALEWLDAEYACLLAAQQLAVEHGWHRAVAQLAGALYTFQTRRGYRHDQFNTWQHGLAAAENLGDAAILAMAHRYLGSAAANLDLHTEALDHLHQALALGQERGDIFAQASAHHVLATIWTMRGENQRALQHATLALQGHQALGNREREAQMLNAVGWCEAQLGQYTQARLHCEAALTMHRRHHDREGQAATLDSLGYIAHNTGHHADALDYYRQAIALWRDLGHAYNQADTLDRLGHTHTALGRHEKAREAWQEALMLYRDQHRASDVERVQRQLDAASKPAMIIGSNSPG